MERSLIGILGASGKVGQLVCDYLVRNTGYVVKAGYRKTIPFLFNGRLRWQFVDIQDKQKLFEIEDMTMAIPENMHYVISYIAK